MASGRGRPARAAAGGLLLLYLYAFVLVRQALALRDLRTVRDLRQLGGTPVGLDEKGRQINGTGGLVFPLSRRDGHIRGHTSRGMLANGTLPLHGAVKDLGYFYAELRLGTPAKRFAVIVDTGSTMTYVPCSYCSAAHCGQNKLNPAFNPKASSTFEQIPCKGDSRCQCGSPACGCDKNKCSYARYYAESSTSEGHMVSDVMHLSDTQSVRVSFGCETKETGEIYNQAADGLMGLGGSDVSIPNQLAKSGAIEPVFSLCFGDMQGSGALMVGNVPLPSELRVRHVPLVHNPRHPHYYNINLHAMSIGPDKLKVPEGEWTKGYGTVLDSGTTFSYIPREAFSALKSAVSKHAALKGLNKVPGPDPKYVDECWGGAPENPNELPRVFPTMTLHLDEDFDLELLPINYLFIHTYRPGAYCLGLFDNGSAGTLLGGITFRNVLVQYDKRDGKNRVGLGHAPCKLLGCADQPDPECCASAPSFTYDGVAPLNEAESAADDQNSAGEPNPLHDVSSTGYRAVFLFIGTLAVISVVVAALAFYVFRSRHYSYLAFLGHRGGSDNGTQLDELTVNPGAGRSGRGSSDGALDDVPLQTPTGGGCLGFGSTVATPTVAMAGGPVNPRSESGVFSAALRRLNSSSADLVPPSGSNPTVSDGSDNLTRGSVLVTRPGPSMGRSDSGSPRD